jgi:branched-chain amino acid transport system permease protein
VRLRSLRLAPGSLRRAGFAGLGIVGLAWILAPWIGVDTYWLIQLVMIAVITLIVSGLNLSYGHAGELSLGQVAMFAVGAYLTGYMALHGLNDLALTLVCAAAAAALIGVVSGVPGLRLGGWSLAMVSFFLVLLIPDFVSIFQGETGGYTGMYGIPEPELFGFGLSTHVFYVASVAIAIAGLAAMRNLVVSRHGDALRVLRESPALARSIGISVFRTKLFAYAMGAVPAGIAGVLFAYLERFVGPDTFSFSFSVAIIAASILGGSESIYGAAFGAALLEVGPLQANLFENYSLLVYGTFLVVGGVLLRGGVARVGTTLVRRYLTRGDDAPALADQPTGGLGHHGAPPSTRIGDLGTLPGQAVAVDDVAIAFGGVRALDGVTLRAAPGRITAIIGSNGSGKTTLLNLVSGFLRATRGQIHVGARRVDGLRPHLIARAGVSRTFQTPIVPRSMSCVAVVGVARYVRPSLSVLATILRLPSSRRVHAADRAEATRCLDILGLGAYADVEATQLPLGSRRLVEMARALVTRPAVVLLDEPASGLERTEVSALGELLTAVAAAGGTVVLVEHNFRFVIDIADYVYVLDRGTVIAAGVPAEIERAPAVIASYLGGELTLDAPAVARAAADRDEGI